jgi:hypothetical protein
LQQLQQLQRRVRALINRLSERTMQKAIDETKALLSDSAHTRQGAADSQFSIVIDVV